MNVGLISTILKLWHIQRTIFSYFLSSYRSSKIMIYLHGNAEDLAAWAEMMRRLSMALKVHVIGFEYPGYGICYKEKVSSKEIISRSKRLYQFLTKEVGYREKDVIIFGRSLGSGAAIQTAAENNPGLLVLMSAYTKIKNVAKDIWCCTPCFIKERFKSINYIKKLSWKFFLIHGKKDKVIRPHHSEDLFARAIKYGKEDLCGITIRADMDHNNFQFGIDIVEPLKNFVKSKFFLIFRQENLIRSWQKYFRKSEIL